MLQAARVGKRFGYRWVLRDVSLRLGPGERLAVCGPNGAGKTTLLRLLAGVSRPTTGEVLLGGKPVAWAEARRLVGYAGHEPFLIPELTAAENLLLAARLYGAGEKEVREALARMGLAAWADVPARALSRGLKQRLALARALVHRPLLLLLDEPHTALDDEGRARLADLLAEHAARGGMAVLATHEPEPGGAVLRLERGRQG